jgi:Fe-S-cluster containining protein
MEDSGEGNGGCQQCGLCCKVFGDRITPTTMNVYSWMEQGRTDILVYFSAVLRSGARVNGADLAPGDLGEVVTIELRDPETGGYLPVCPFLRRTGKTRYICSIHTVKPDMCCNYMPWVYGETYFPRCPAQKGKKSRWSGLPDSDSP